MNFFDYLANPLALVDKKGEWTPNTSKVLGLGSDPFHRRDDQTGAGKPALQSFARNLSDALHGSKITDYTNTRMLQDAPADPNPEQTRMLQQQRQAPASLQYNANQDPMQQMITEWMKLGGTR